MGETETTKQAAYRRGAQVALQDERNREFRNDPAVRAAGGYEAYRDGYHDVERNRTPAPEYAHVLAEVRRCGAAVWVTDENEMDALRSIAADCGRRDGAKEAHHRGEVLFALHSLRLAYDRAYRDAQDAEADVAERPSKKDDAGDGRGTWHSPDPRPPNACQRDGDENGHDYEVVSEMKLASLAAEQSKTQTERISDRQTAHYKALCNTRDRVKEIEAVLLRTANRLARLLGPESEALDSYGAADVPVLQLLADRIGVQAGFSKTHRTEINGHSDRLEALEREAGALRERVISLGAGYDALARNVEQRDEETKQKVEALEKAASQFQERIERESAFRRDLEQEIGALRERQGVEEKTRREQHEVVDDGDAKRDARIAAADETAKVARLTADQANALGLRMAKRHRKVRKLLARIVRALDARYGKSWGA